MAENCAETVKKQPSENKVPWLTQEILNSWYSHKSNKEICIEREELLED